ncbi:MAG: hypothetical protein ACXU85_15620 [Xanthobacteraceae bacterium]
MATDAARADMFPNLLARHASLDAGRPVGRDNLETLRASRFALRLQCELMMLRAVCWSTVAKRWAEQVS